MKLYLTPQEVAARLRIGKSTVYRAINDGSLAAYKFGGYRISEEAVEAWVESRRVKPPPLRERGKSSQGRDFLDLSDFLSA